MAQVQPQMSTQSQALLQTEAWLQAQAPQSPQSQSQRQVEASNDTVPSLVAALCPVFVFHVKEQQRPCSLEAMQSQSHTHTAKPVAYYWHNEQEHSITYVLCYMKDDGPVALCMPGCHVGGHAWDVEFVRVFYDPAAPQLPTHAYFSAHASDQGTWVQYSREQALDRTHITAHVALGSHAMYPQSGTVWRIFGFGNDMCSEQRQDGINVFDPAAEGTLLPMPSAESLDSQKWDSFMQWKYSTDGLKGAPRNDKTARWYRLAYPLSKRILK